MSLNRLSYDSCAYNASLQQSVAPISYTLDPIKYEHCGKCRVELGIVGGTAVSHINGNLVDLENDLRGQTRTNTHCPVYKYLPPSGNVIKGGPDIVKPVVHPTIDLNMKHLPPCQMVNYGSVPLTPAMNLSSCSRNSI